MEKLRIIVKWLFLWKIPFVINTVFDKKNYYQGKIVLDASHPGKI